MTAEQATAFFLFALVAVITPGPSNILLTSTGTNVGVLRGLPCLFGVTVGMGAMMVLVAFGLGTLEAVRAIQADPQLASRFYRTELPLWRMGREYRKLLASFERMLPLKRPSQLAKAPLATKLLAMTEGTIGELSTLLKSAAIYAVRTGTERIDTSVLAGLEWEPPSTRHPLSLGHG
jgi:Bacterial TniB protein